VRIIIVSSEVETSSVADIYCVYSYSLWREIIDVNQIVDVC